MYLKGFGMDATTVTYAGFWKRFVARLLDSMIIGLSSLIVLLVVGIFTGIGFGISAMSVENWEDIVPVVIVLFGLYGVVLVCITWLYYALLESSARQATVGKMVMGIVVTDLNNNRITFGRATGRYFAKILSGLIFCIGYMMAGFTQKKQALHDMLSGCLVANKPFVLPPTSNQIHSEHPKIG